MLFLLAFPALAVPAPTACTSTLAINDTVPGPGAEGVPVDVRPAVVFVGNCATSGPWALALTRQDDGTVVGATEPAYPTETHLLELFPSADLEPDTAYTLTITPEGESEVTAGFTTGTETITGLTGAPTLTVDAASYNPDVATLSATVRVDQATDPDVLSILQVRDADELLATQAFVAPPTGEVERTLEWAGEGAQGEVCLQVRQIDGAGVATEWSSPDCIALGGCGCATSGPATGLLGLALALASVLRRRA